MADGGILRFAFTTIRFSQRKGGAARAVSNFEMADFEILGLRLLRLFLAANGRGSAQYAILRWRILRFWDLRLLC